MAKITVWGMFFMLLTVIPFSKMMSSIFMKLVARVGTVDEDKWAMIGLGAIGATFGLMKRGGGLGNIPGGSISKGNLSRGLPNLNNGRRTTNSSGAATQNGLTSNPGAGGAGTQNSANTNRNSAGGAAQQTTATGSPSVLPNQGRSSSGGNRASLGGNAGKSNTTGSLKNSGVSANTGSPNMASATAATGSPGGASSGSIPPVGSAAGINGTNNARSISERGQRKMEDILQISGESGNKAAETMSKVGAASSFAVPGVAPAMAGIYAATGKATAGFASTAYNLAQEFKTRKQNGQNFWSSMQDITGTNNRVAATTKMATALTLSPMGRRVSSQGSQIAGKVANWGSKKPKKP